MQFSFRKSIEDPRELKTHDSWTCAQWVVEITRRLGEWDLMVLDIGKPGWEAVYNQIVKLATKYEETKRAHMVGGIPVLQYPFLAC